MYAASATPKPVEATSRNRAIAKEIGHHHEDEPRRPAAYGEGRACPEGDEEVECPFRREAGLVRDERLEP